MILDNDLLLDFIEMRIMIDYLCTCKCHYMLLS